MLAGPMGIRNTKRQITIIIKMYKVSRKQFGANRVGLRVKRRLHVFYVQHLVE